METREKISLVILDLIMPEMGGKQCLEELLKIDPKARVLVASGYSADGPTKEACKAGQKGSFQNPLIWDNFSKPFARFWMVNRNVFRRIQPRTFTAQ